MTLPVPVAPLFYWLVGLFFCSNQSPAAKLSGPKIKTLLDGLARAFKYYTCQSHIQWLFLFLLHHFSLDLLACSSVTKRCPAAKLSGPKIKGSLLEVYAGVIIRWNKFFSSFSTKIILYVLQRDHSIIQRLLTFVDWCSKGFVFDCCPNLFLTIIVEHKRKYTFIIIKLLNEI